MPLITEVSVKKTTIRSLLILLSLLCAAMACNRSETAHTSTVAPTQTIAPAAAPAAPTGTDAMTQTVDIEDSRSEAEGGTITEPTTAAPPAGTPAAAPKAKPPAGKKSTKKH